MTKIKQLIARDAPLWSLLLVAVLCFGPLILIWLLGLLMVPFWLVLLMVPLSEPERFAHDLAGSTWDLIWPIGVVVAGFVGIAGLLRVLTLPRRQRPQRHRVFTLGMVAVGLVGLAIFDAPFVQSVTDVSSLADGAALARAFAIFFAMPFGGAAWVLAKSWRFLIASGATTAETGHVGTAHTTRTDGR